MENRPVPDLEIRSRIFAEITLATTAEAIRIKKGVCNEILAYGTAGLSLVSGHMLNHRDPNLGISDNALSFDIKVLGKAPFIAPL